MQEQAVPCQNSHTGSELVVSLRSQAALRYWLIRPWTTWVRLIRAVTSTSWPGLVQRRSLFPRLVRPVLVIVPRVRGEDLIGKNVAELVDLPEGQPGGPSRAMTEEQASKVLAAATGTGNAYVKVIRIGEARTAATHAANRGRPGRVRQQAAQEGRTSRSKGDLRDATYRVCRAQLDIDADANPRLEALFVLSITLGLRPGELRALTRDHVDLDQGVIHVWRSTRRDGDTKTLARAPPGAPSTPSRRTGSARTPSGSRHARHGTTPTSSSAMRTGASTAATRSTGGSAR